MDKVYEIQEIAGKAYLGDDSGQPPSETLEQILDVKIFSKFWLLLESFYLTEGLLLSGRS